MDKLLKKFGYLQQGDPNTWTKKVWTVRFENEDYMEVFDTTVNDEGWLYYYGPTSKLEDVLEQIEKFPDYRPLK